MNLFLLYASHGKMSRNRDLMKMCRLLAFCSDRRIAYIERQRRNDLIAVWSKFTPRPSLEQMRADLRDGHWSNGDEYHVMEIKPLTDAWDHTELLMNRAASWLEHHPQEKPA